jgi:hypothetical protein
MKTDKIVLEITFTRPEMTAAKTVAAYAVTAVKEELKTVYGVSKCAVKSRQSKRRSQNCDMPPNARSCLKGR